MTTESQQKNTATGEITYEVAVHKANLPLAKDESVHDFTSVLGEAARAYVYQQKRMDSAKSDYCYVVEVYTTTVVMSYSMYGDNKKSMYGYVSLTYSRDTDTKQFTFSDLTEVERVTSYRPKTLIKTLKSATINADIEVPQPGTGAPDWQPKVVAKSFWAGVI